MKNYKLEIGLRLKQARKDKGLTQEKISELLSISQKHYSEVERGITGLSVKHYIQLSDILAISLDYLLKGTAPEAPSTAVKTNLQINELFYSSSEHTQQKMLQLLQIAKDIESHSRTTKHTSQQNND